MDQTLLSTDQPFPPDQRLVMDMASIGYLGETASWAKFLAIVGFVMCGLFVAFGLFMGTFTSTMGSRMDMPFGGFGSIMTLMYIGLAVLYFFPCYYMYVFATRMKRVIATNDQTQLSSSFQNLKSSFKFAGIMMLVFIGIWVLGMLGGLAGALMMR
jgi:hypothetical protein